MHFPIQRRDSIGKRDVRWYPGCEGRRHRGHPNRISSADQNSHRKRSVRERHIREENELAHNEMGIFDVWQL